MEIKLYQKPFDYKILPPVFVAVDTLTYSRLVDLQQAADKLITHQRVTIESLQTEVLSLQRTSATCQERLEVAKEYSQSQKVELQLTNQALEDSQRRGNNNILVFGLSGFVAGVFVGIIAR